jgi:PAS domain S-box-containing protein
MTLPGSYSPPLVFLSVVIASLASYTALDLAGRLSSAAGRPRLGWLLGSSLALGVGIWSMHFVGMLAFDLPIPVTYGVDLVLLSVLVAIAASGLALFVVSRPGSVPLAALALAALWMGPAIAGMHYIGMAAMRMEARVSYRTDLVVASVAIAVGASFVALWLSRRFRVEDSSRWVGWKVVSGVVMGGAIAGMHYTAMAAAQFTASPSMVVPPAWELSPSFGLAVAVAGGTLIILGLGLLSAMTDRWMRARLRHFERLRGSYEAVSCGIVVEDATGVVVHANEAAATLLGVPRPALLGSRIADLGRRLVGEDGAPIPADQHPLTVVRRTGQPVRGVMQGLDLGTEHERWLLVDAIPVVDTEHGALEEVIASFTDITERRRVETALKQTTETLSALIQGSPLAIYALDPEGRVTSWNPASERLFGWRATEVLGHPLPIVTPEDREGFARRQALILSGQSFLGLEIPRQRRDGSRLTMSLSGAPLYEGTTQVHGMIYVAADVTERKKLEDQLRQSQKMEAVGQLAGGVAHDFNNLLTAIAGYTSLLLNNLEPGDPRRQDVVEIQLASDRATQVTHQLLAFSRKQMLQPAPLDLNLVLADLMRMLGRLLGEDIELAIVTQPGIGAILADRGQIEQVVLNLAVNARDAMPQGGKLTLETGNVELDEAYVSTHLTGRPGSHVMLAVTDTGTGMDEYTKGHIFEPFFTTKGPEQGTGLGLATVYGIVKQSGGNIWVYSEPGHGTTFKIYFPRTGDAALLDAGRTPEPSTLHGTETVLLVEDNEGVRSFAVRVLKAYGYTVLEAANGGEAILLAEQHDGGIHLVFTDVVLPRMSGPKLADRLSTIRPGIRVLYMSGYTDDAIVHHGALDPGAAFLQKPFRPEVLARRLREVLDR